MDPVTAIGLVSGIAGLLDIAVKVGKQAKELSDSIDQLPKDLGTSEVLSTDLAGILSNLQQSRPTKDEDLLEIVKLCQKQTDLLLAILDSLKYQSASHKPSYLRNIARALRIRKKEEEIRKLQAILADFERRLTFHLGIRIYETSEDISKKLDTLMTSFERQTQALENLKQAAKQAALSKDGLTVPVEALSGHEHGQPHSTRTAGVSCAPDLVPSTNPSIPVPASLKAPGGSITAWVGGVGLSIAWNVHYAGEGHQLFGPISSGDLIARVTSSWISWFLYPSKSHGELKSNATVCLKISGDDGRPIVRKVTCPSTMTRNEFFDNVSRILERPNCLREKLEEIASIVSDGKDITAGNSRRRMETSINAHLLRYHGSMFAADRGEAAPAGLMITTNRDTGWFFEIEDLAPYWRRINYLNIMVHLPSFYFFYLSPPRRFALLFPWTSAKSHYCIKLAICTKEQRIQAICGRLDAHDILLLCMTCMAVVQIRHYWLNKDFYRSGKGHEVLIRIPPPWYELLVDYHVKFMLLLFRAWDIMEDVRDLVSVVFTKLAHGQVTSQELYGAFSKLAGYLIAAITLLVLLSYLQAFMGAMNFTAAAIWSVLGYAVLSTLYEKRARSRAV